ncbi:MAG: G5 domain-containing protein [Defluviitaleaceae bacterium]|nr:G5 domain-containing protein [Defluviitaleaceae bacterium]
MSNMTNMSNMKPLPKPVRANKPIKRIQLPSNPMDNLPPDTPIRPTPVNIPQMRQPAPPLRQSPKVQPARTSGRTGKYTPKRAKYVKKTPVSRKISRRVGKVRRFLHRTKLVGIVSAVILVATMAFLIFWNMTRDNAIAIYIGVPQSAVAASNMGNIASVAASTPENVNDENGENGESSETSTSTDSESEIEPLAFIELTDEMTDTALRMAAINRLEALENARIVLSDTISIARVNTSSQNIVSFDEAVNMLVENLQFRILGVAVEVEGSRVGVLRNQADANELIRRLQQPYMFAPEYVSVEFVEDFVMSNVDIDESQLNTLEEILARLEGDATVTEDYIVQPGDSLGIIALRHGITLEQLYANNPTISSTTILQVGEVLRIQSLRPYLSVRTVEEVTRTEEIPIETETVANPGESSTFSQVIRAGTPGEQEVVIHITRINGLQVGEEEIVATRVIQEMITTTLEVGTA